MKIQKKLLFSVLSGVMFMLASCGGDPSTSSGQEEQSSSTVESSEAPVSSVVDANAKSDSKGVGKFTSVQIGELDKGLAEKGKAIFESKCASCHKTAADKLVGPGMKGVTERRTPEWIMNMITNPEEMTKKDPVAKALFEEHLIQMTFQNVSDDEAREILEFLRQNDNQ